MTRREQDRELTRLVTEFRVDTHKRLSLILPYSPQLLLLWSVVWRQTTKHLGVQTLLSSFRGAELDEDLLHAQVVEDIREEL